MSKKKAENKQKKKQKKTVFFRFFSRKTKTNRQGWNIHNTANKKQTKPDKNEP